MNFRWIRKLSLWPFLSILIGFIAFFSITGGKILWPTYTAWIMDGDPAQSLVGWQFFRYSPTLQWPIGVNPNYGMNIGSSIVFTDSLPLLAFFFKPLSTLLPETFQYLGLWILICFSLQSFFAWKLLSLFTQDKWLPLIGSIFFTLAPVYLSRLTVVSCHYALFGQWVLLAALHYYFTKDLSIFRWIGLLAATVLIHAYLFAMVFVIWSADLIQRCWLKQTNISKTLNYFVAGSLTIAIIMWATGYFMLGKDIADSGFGHTRMNLLSLINPEEIWSKLLPAQKGGSGDYEGFNYLGLGMLGLCLVAVYVFLRNVKISHKVKIIPIFIISVGFFLFAISNKVAIGTHELFSYNLPLIAKPFAYTFRASGRFFWPVTYLIYLTTFYLLFTRLKRNAIIMLCVVMLCLQIIDSANAWRTLRKDIYRSSAWVSPMQSPAWSDIAHRYRQIIFVPPSNMPANWMPLAHFAATHRMAINIGYFTRVKRDKMREERARII
ncbi:MAG: DUF6311 domain-containing protein, partial [Syntrophales bacterium LBB04]|nr:DUF6311 domain-containing protein [Syntrophales bacterium LBB04]